METFKFQNKNNAIYRLDPRLKIYLLIVYSILAIIFNNIFLQLSLFISIFFIFSMTKSINRLFSFLRSLSFLIFIVFIVNFMFFTLEYTLIMELRLLVMMSSFLIFFTTIHPDKLVQGLTKLKIPFHHAFIFSLATRFVPTLAQESEIISNAQKSRGLDLESGNLITKIKNYLPLFVPLFINAIRRAYLIAESLETKGFGSRKDRTFLDEIKFTWKSYILFIFLTVILILSIYLIYFSNIPIISLSYFIR
ncbi:MAG: energy-coupling factor transporter transmembrane component T family protein [Candidatus Helarchaeota archaeon]